MATTEIHLKKGDSPFHDDSEKSYTLPARFYTDNSIYELEKDAIFYKSCGMQGMSVNCRKRGTI